MRAPTIGNLPQLCQPSLKGLSPGALLGTACRWIWVKTVVVASMGRQMDSRTTGGRAVELPRFTGHVFIRAERKWGSAVTFIGDQGEALPALRRFEIEGVPVEKPLPVVHMNGSTRPRLPQAQARRMLTLPESVECEHCWYEECEDDRHVPQVVMTAPEAAHDSTVSGRVVGW